ncbi:MAG: UDP-N-acetylmuramate dehydrogenase [Defluviitaleaceae bacterium]|nr:UDP-N-acetylmuramate dehydrogenase [Defluviitaleaceae bacterium]
MLLDGLKKILCENKIFTDFPMAKYTSFKIGGLADFFILPDSLAEIAGIVNFCKKNEVQLILLGRATNVLVSDKGIHGVVMSLANFNKINLPGDCKIIAEAGAPLVSIANAAEKNGLAGIEFAHGIPGTAGGAVNMNAGAYGRSMSDVCISVDIFTNERIIETVSANKMDFDYRTSCFQNDNTIILSTVFQLQPGNREQIKNEISELNKKRRQSQPLDYPSAGSIFKRPRDYFAGKLIEDSNLKGYSVGGAQVSQKHAGFIINNGHATADDVKKLINHITETVYKNYGVLLETEIKFLGE